MFFSPRSLSRHTPVGFRGYFLPGRHDESARNAHMAAVPLWFFCLWNLHFLHFTVSPEEPLENSTGMSSVLTCRRRKSHVCTCAIDRRGSVGKDCDTAVTSAINQRRRRPSRHSFHSGIQARKTDGERGLIWRLRDSLLFGLNAAKASNKMLF